jgi:hypothetical protein
MNRHAALFAVLASLATPALADKKADDSKWIGQCVIDNKDEGQTADVVTKYCACMNNQMSDDDTMSISQWEKANPKVMESCSKKAGWTGK